MIKTNCEGDRIFAFDPARTAFILIDMQRDFLDPEGASGIAGENTEALRGIVPACERALGDLRRAGAMIVHTREGHLPDLSDLHEAKRARSAADGAEIGSMGPLGRFLVRGEFGHDFVDELRPLEGETVIDKPGFGSFYATDLRARLEVRGITHLIIGGVTTQCCVQSTLREAVDRGYECLTLADCTAAFDPALHAATLAIIRSEGNLFGWISDSKALAHALA